MSHFIPNGFLGSSRDTAVLLVGTASEFEIDQHDIVKTQGGYNISDALHEILKAETEVSRNPKKASGNRAAKKNSKEE